MPPKSVNPKQTASLLLKLKQNDLVVVGNILRGAPHLLATRDENQIFVLEHILQHEQLLLKLAALETFPLNLFLQLVVAKNNLWHILEQVLSIVCKSCVIEQDVFFTLYEKAPEQYWQNIVSCVAVKQADSVFLHAVLQNLCTGNKWDTLLCHACNIKVQDMASILQACAKQNQVAAGQILKCSGIQFDSFKLVKAFEQQRELLTMTQQLNILFPNCKVLDALCNVEHPLQNIHHLVNKFESNDVWLSKLLVKIIFQRDPDSQLGYNVIHLDMQDSVQACVKNRAYPEQRMQDIAFIKQVEAQGHQWTVNQMQLMLQANRFHSEKVAVYLATQHVLPPSCVEMLVQYNHVKAMKIVASKQKLPLQDLLPFAFTLDMVRVLVEHGAVLTPEIIIKSFNCNLFISVKKEFNMDTSLFMNQDFNRILFNSSQQDRVQFMKLFGILNDSCIEGFCYAMVASEHVDALQYWQLLTKNPLFYKIFYDTKKEYFSNCIRKYKTNGIGNYVLYLNPQILDRPTSFEFYDSSYGETYVQTDDFVSFALRCSDFELLNFVLSNCKCIAHGSFSAETLELFIEQNKSMTGMHMFVETVNANQYGPEHCPKKNKEWFNALPRIHVTLFAQHQSFPVIFHDSAQLIRSIKRKCSLPIYCKLPLLSFFSKATKKWEWLTENCSMSQFANTALSVLAHSTLYIAIPQSFCDVHIK